MDVQLAAAPAADRWIGSSRRTTLTAGTSASGAADSGSSSRRSIHAVDSTVSSSVATVLAPTNSSQPVYDNNSEATQSEATCCYNTSNVMISDSSSTATSSSSISELGSSETAAAVSTLQDRVVAAAAARGTASSSSSRSEGPITTASSAVPCTNSSSSSQSCVSTVGAADMTVVGSSTQQIDPGQGGSSSSAQAETSADSFNSAISRSLLQDTVPAGSGGSSSAGGSRPTTPETSATSSSSSASSSSSSEAGLGTNPLALAAAAAAAPGKRTHPLLQQQRMFDVLDGCSVALTTTTLALATTLCALTLNMPGLAWAGVVLLGFIIAAPVVVGGVILARNHWLLVALKYCMSVAALQRDSGLNLGGLRSRVLKVFITAVSSFLLSLVGFVVAFYLTACYVVTAVLSVPLLDIAVLVSLIPRLRKKFISQDLVFLESYKPARSLATALLQALPLAAIALVLLIAAAAPAQPAGLDTAAAAAASLRNSSSSQQFVTNSSSYNATAAAAAAAAAATNANSSSGVIDFVTTGQSLGARRLLLSRQQQQQREQHRKLAAAAAAVAKPTNGSSSSSSGAWSTDTITKVLAVALNRGTKAASAVAALMVVGSNGSSSSTAAVAGSSSSSSDAGSPTVQVIATETQQGNVELTVVVPPTGTAAPADIDAVAAAAGSSNATSSSSSALSRRSGSRASSSSSSNSFFVLAPDWRVITASAKQLPTGLLLCCVIFGLLEVIAVLLLLLAGCWKARVGFWRQLILTLRLKGGVRVPDFIAAEALSTMLKDNGKKLSFSNVWYWNSQHRDHAKLPLVPRYLFPPDGGWLVPGQLCHLAALAYSTLSSSSSGPAAAAAVETLELEHVYSSDIAVLLAGALDHLPALKAIHLNWCCVGAKSLPAKLSSVKTLRTLSLNRCEVTDPGADAIKTLISNPGSTLITLSVVKCHVGVSGVRALAAGVGANKTLTHVKFAGSNGGKPVATSFAAALRSNSSIQHLNISFNKMTAAGGEALAAALTDIAAAGSSSSSLERLVIQRKEVGGPGLRSLIQAVRDITRYDGKLTVRVGKGPGSGSSCGLDAGGHWIEPWVLQIVELPVVFVCHEESEVLMSEKWLTEDLKCLPSTSQQQQQQQVGSGGIPSCSHDMQLLPAAAAAAACDARHTVIHLPDHDRHDQQASDPNLQAAGAAEQSPGLKHAVITVLDDKQQQQQQCWPQDVASERDQSTSCFAAGTSSAKDAGSSSSSMSGSSSSGAAAPVAAAAAAGLSRSPLNIKTAESMLSDGPTPAGSTADVIPQTTIAAAAAAAAAASPAAASSSTPGSSSSSVWCPQLIFVSQNDPAESVASVLKHVEGVQAVDLSNMPLGAKGTKSLCNALPEARSLQQLLLRNTGISEDGLAALAAALRKPAAAVGPAAAAAAAAAADQNGRRRRGDSSSTVGSSGSSSADQICITVDQSSADQQVVEQSSVVVRSQLNVLDLSNNTICDTGAAALVEVLQSGACPKLTSLNLESNRYPFDWATILKLHQLEIKQPGLKVELGAPSNWCLNPSRVLTAAAAAADSTAGSSSASSSSSICGSSIGSEDLCGVCFDAPNTIHIRDCSHRLCTGCYKQLIKAASGGSSSSRQQQQGGGVSGAACPFCRQPMAGFVYSAWVQNEDV